MGQTLFVSEVFAYLTSKQSKAHVLLRERSYFTLGCFESYEVSETRIKANAFSIFLKCAYQHTVLHHRQKLFRIQLQKYKMYFKNQSTVLNDKK